MKNISSFYLAGWLAVTALSAQGCVLLAGAAVGAGAAAYHMGKLEQNVDYGVDTVHDATLKALKKLDMYIISDNSLVNGSKIEAETAEGQKVKIDIEPLTEKATKINIRVGLVGDEERSYMIFNAIKKQL